MANTGVKAGSAAKATPKPASPGKAGKFFKELFPKLKKFFRETWIELKKTSWPKKDELRKGTLLVLAALAMMTLYIGGLDFILKEIFTLFKL